MHILELRNSMEDIDMLIVKGADKNPVNSFDRVTVAVAVPLLHLPLHPVPPILEFLSILRLSVTPDKVAAEFSPFERVRFCDGVDVAGCCGCDGLTVGCSA